MVHLFRKSRHGHLQNQNTRKPARLTILLHILLSNPGCRWCRARHRRRGGARWCRRFHAPCIEWTAAARASQAWMLTSSSQSLTFVSTLLAVAWGGDRLAKSLDRGTRSGVNPARQVDLRVFRIQASEPNVRRVKKGPPISIVVVSPEPFRDFFQSKDFINKQKNLFPAK